MSWAAFSLLHRSCPSIFLSNGEARGERDSSSGQRVQLQRLPYSLSSWTLIDGTRLLIMPSVSSWLA
ncbi:hypothetical protein LEMLEM_LOCUS23137 [Lemmus lemmus]